MTFSIIVPAYNAEGHIEPLLNSIRNQTYKDYELIVICDSCTDRTEEIARSYGAITANVSFHSDGLTRDRGLELATGDWILFADDDDWFYCDEAFQQLADFIGTQDDDVDAIAFGHECRGRGYIPPAEDKLFVARRDHVWSTCWKHSSIGDTRFGDAVFCSDTYFMKAMKPHVRRAAFLDTPIYYYNFMRKGSQTDLFCKGIIRESPVAE